MARRKKLSERKKEIISYLINEYEIESAKDIHDAIKEDVYKRQKGNVLIDRNKSNLEGLENVTIPIYTFNNVEYTRVEVATFFQPASNKMKEFLENEENFIVMIANVKYYIDNEVVGLLMYFLNYEDIKNYDLEIKTELELKRLLDDYIKKNVVNSELVFESFDARPAVAQKMNIEIGDTIIYFSEQMKRDNNTIALYRRSYFNPNYYSFKINRDVYKRQGLLQVCYLEQF